jgi:hypothetical protein
LESSTFNKVDRFLIEYHDFYFKDGNEKVENLKNKLISNGYRIIMKHKFIYAEK